MYSFTSEAYNTQLWCSRLQNRMGFEVGEPTHFLFLFQTFVLGKSGVKEGAVSLAIVSVHVGHHNVGHSVAKDEWTLSASFPSPCRHVNAQY